MNYQRILPLGFVLLGWVLVPAIVKAQATGTANPVADAFVTTGPSGDLVNNNYGGAGALAISGTGATRGVTPGFRGVFDTVIRFDFSAVKTQFDIQFGSGAWTVQSASLQLTTAGPANPIFNDNSAGDFSISRLSVNSWTEGVGGPSSFSTDGITYASLQTLVTGLDENLGTFTFNAGSIGAASLYTLTLSPGLFSDITGGGETSLHLFAATPGVSYVFNAGEFATVSTHPLFTVTATAIPEPASYSLLALSAVFLWGVIRKRRRSS